MFYNLKFIRPEYFIEGKQLYLLDDNATPHRTPCVMKLLEQLNIESIIHPSCSPDLAPSDFYLFRKLNNWLNGQDYKDKNQLIEGVKSYLYGQDEDFYSKGIDELRNQWECITQSNGSYIINS
jgi:transposase